MSVPFEAGERALAARVGKDALAALRLVLEAMYAEGLAEIRPI